MCLDNVTLPAWPGTRNRLGLRHHGLIPVHLDKCLFLLSLPFLCVAYSCAVVDKKDHTTGAIQDILILSFCPPSVLFPPSFRLISAFLPPSFCHPSAFLPPSFRLPSAFLPPSFRLPSAFLPPSFCGYLYIIIYTKIHIEYLSKTQDDRTTCSQL